MGSVLENAEQDLAAQGVLEPRRTSSVGMLTMAYGPRKFLAMAVSLARSLRLHQPDMPRAIVTDSRDAEVLRAFDVVLPLNPAYGTMYFQKMSADLYSPFDATVYIDSDCLAFRSIAPYLDDLLAGPVGVIGRDMTEGTNRWWGVNFGEFTKRHKLAWMPTFQGGVFAFKKSAESSAVLSGAREVMASFDSYGFTGDGRYTGLAAVNDEPCLALSLAKHGVHAVPDDGAIMRVPVGLQGPLTIDVLRGVSRLKMNGEVVRPAIVHFADVWNREPIYRREQMKLALVDRLPMSRSMISHAVNLAFNPPYCFYSGAVRAIKRVVRGGRRPNHPVALWP